MKKIAIWGFIVPLLALGQAQSQTLPPATSKLQAGLWGFEEHIVQRDKKIKEQGISLGMLFNKPLSQNLELNTLARIGVGTYKGYTLEEMKKVNPQSVKENVIRLETRYGLSYKINPYISIMGEMGLDGRFIDPFGHNRTTELTLYAQPGVKISPLGNQLLSIEVLQPWLSQRTGVGTFTPEAKTPLIRLASEWAISKNSTFSANIEYLETKDSEMKYYKPHNTNYYQPRYKKSSLNLEFKHLF